MNLKDGMVAGQPALGPVPGAQTDAKPSFAY
jgi:hypothetical protein